MVPFELYFYGFIVATWMAFDFDSFCSPGAGSWFCSLLSFCFVGARDMDICTVAELSLSEPRYLHQV
jgi:hypothetical protein